MSEDFGNNFFNFFVKTVLLTSTIGYGGFLIISDIKDKLLNIFDRTELDKEISEHISREDINMQSEQEKKWNLKIGLRNPFIFQYTKYKNNSPSLNVTDEINNIKIKSNFNLRL